jgi:hypothetical protein
MAHMRLYHQVRSEDSLFTEPVYEIASPGDLVTVDLPIHPTCPTLAKLVRLELPQELTARDLAAPILLTTTPAAPFEELSQLLTQSHPSPDQAWRTVHRAVILPSAAQTLESAARTISFGIGRNASAVSPIPAGP